MLLSIAFLLVMPGVFQKDDSFENKIDFQLEVRPILADNCFSCHGPDPAGRDSDLRLDSEEEALKDLGGYAAIVPGDVAASELIYKVTAEDIDERMPPPDSHLFLLEEEIDVLKSWIKQGAEFAPHWSYEVPEKVLPPAVENQSWVRDPIDAFILNRLDSLGVSPSIEADSLVWLRRVFFVLTGLPPTPENCRKFLASSAENKYEAVVDGLLASPRFGERMAQPWLDIARYADTFGYQSDVASNVWPYRDWVIEAWNDNLPYDQFLRWQVAGDLIPNATVKQKIATAFNRLHRQTNEGGSVEEEYRVEYVNDRVQTMGSAFMGLTLECAKCHDHRYDPISQKEYYQLFAYFDDIDESGLYSHFTSAVPTPALSLPSEAQAELLIKADDALEIVKNEMGPQRSFENFFKEKPTNSFNFNDREDLITVQSPSGRAVQLNGDVGVRFPGAGHWSRSNPFGISLTLKIDRFYERAVVLHRSRAWTDAASQGWQIVLEDGRVFFGLIHFWPGDAIAIRSKRELPLDEWVTLSVTYDGSSEADGLRIYLNNQLQEIDVVRDSLTKTITGGGPGDPTLGERFRDNGLVGGLVDEVEFFDFLRIYPELVSLRDARKKRDDVLDSFFQLMVMEEGADPKDAFLLNRGNYFERKEEVFASTPFFLKNEESVDSENRVDLVDWLLSESHPLTARVEVDRLWRTVFGFGLVRTPEDFGSQGRPPTHPDLLDYLSWELRRLQWDRKALLKRLVLSSTFRQSSRASSEDWLRDPSNENWARGPSFPLPSEMLRDNALMASGLLVEKIGGPSVMPYQPAGLWRDKGSAQYVQAQGDGLYRRSLYTFWKRTSPPPSMIIFDAVTRDVCVTRRQPTNTPLQSLALWNDPQFGEAARVLAAKICRLDNPLEEAFLALSGRWPRADELAPLAELFSVEKMLLQNDLKRARLIVSVGDSVSVEDIDLVHHASLSLVCAAIMASDPVTILR